MNTRAKTEVDSSRDLGIYLKYYFLLSLIIAVAAHLVTFITPSAMGDMLHRLLSGNALDSGALRALIYFSVMYVFVIPPFSYLFHCRLKNYKYPSHNLAQRIVYTLFCVIFLSAMCAFPFLFLLTENSSYGYAGFVHRGLTDSILSLSIIGALFSYAATVCFWLLFYAVPRMWKNSNN